jgi:nucleosome binding factor SPN SPT16 subunit
MVDAPPKVEATYTILLNLYNTCVEKMIVGNEFKDVLDTARSFLKKKDANLLSYLPKTLGFVIGIEFRDGSLLLNATNQTKFASGMTINLVIGLHNVPLSEEEKKNSPESIKKLEVFSLLLSDFVCIQDNGGLPDILTKFSKEFVDVS